MGVRREELIGIFRKLEAEWSLTLKMGKEVWHIETGDVKWSSRRGASKGTRDMSSIARCH